jgi:serine/threonine protein kinase
VNVTSRDEGEEKMAAKIMLSSGGRSKASFADFNKEMCLIKMASKGSKYACRFYGVAKTRKGHALLMKLYNGSLENFLDDFRGNMDEPLFKKIMADIVRGLDDLHQMGMILQDLKPANVLFDGETDRFVLSDFGLATVGKFTFKARTIPRGGAHAFDEEGEEDDHDSKTLVMHPQRFAGMGGTRYYYCKIDVDRGRINHKTDMYTLGQTAYHIWTRHYPTKNPSPLPHDIPYRDLLQQCLEMDQKDRPSASEFRRKMW